jgi:hypothetical protein
MVADEPRKCRDRAVAGGAASNLARQRLYVERIPRHRHEVH